MSREITIGVCNECQKCDLMKYKPYQSAMVPYCALFKTFLQFREYKNDKIIIKPCFECYECSSGNTHFFNVGAWAESEE